VGYISAILLLLAVMYTIAPHSTGLPAHACALLDSAAYFRLSVLAGCSYAGAHASYGTRSVPLLNRISSGSGQISVLNKHGG